MPESNDEARALLDAYARATTPSPAEIERSLTRTLARIETAKRSGRIPDRRRKFAWVAAAGVATLVLATAAIAGIRWYRTVPRTKAETYGAARLDQIEDAKPNARAQPRRAELTQPQQVSEPPAVEPSELVDSNSTAAVEPAAAAEPKPEPAPRRRSPPKPEPEPKPPASEAKPSAPADASMLAEESRLLARARRALRDDDFEAALEWAEEHARRHPQGSLSEERLILEAVAACRGDQRERGLAAARQLREQFPKTAALAKVEQACAE